MNAPGKHRRCEPKCRITVMDRRGKVICVNCKREQTQ